MLEYFVKDSDASLIITTSNHEETIADLSRKVEVPMLIFDKKLIEEATELKKVIQNLMVMVIVHITIFLKHYFPFSGCTRFFIRCWLGS